MFLCDKWVYRETIFLGLQGSTKKATVSTPKADLMPVIQDYVGFEYGEHNFSSQRHGRRSCAEISLHAINLGIDTWSLTANLTLLPRNNTGRAGKYFAHLCKSKLRMVFRQSLNRIESNRIKSNTFLTQPMLLKVSNLLVVYLCQNFSKKNYFGAA